MKETLTAASRTRGRRRAPETDGREHLLDCATRLFAEQGIAATTMAQIAEAGGVTSAMVHYYFRNRETLLDVIVEERIMQAIGFVCSAKLPPPCARRMPRTASGIIAGMSVG